VEKTTAYLQHGLVPAAERAGIRPFGCFNALIAPDTPFMLTLASYPSMAAFDAAREKLAADKEFQAAVDEYNTIGELSYIRMENSLLSAFPSYPVGDAAAGLRQSRGPRVRNPHLRIAHR
jgi:hypothetical protein